MDVDDVYFNTSATQVAKTSVVCVKSFQAEWFIETAITIVRRDHAI